MIPESLWEVIQSALDQRREPLDEEAVREHLLSHPEDLAELDRLSAQLDDLAGLALSDPLGGDDTVLATEDLATRGSRRWAALVVGHSLWRTAAAALFLCLVVFSWARHEQPLPTAPAVEPVGLVRILSWKITVARTDPSGTSSEVLRPASLRTTHRPARSDSQQPLRSIALAWTDS